MNLTLMASALALAGALHGPDHDHDPKLGKVAFETSCTADASAKVQQGLSWLHSFGYEQAVRLFEQAAATDPSCGIALWGAAMTYYHPVWAPPTPAELAKARSALDRAKAVGAKTQRERDYLSAIATFYQDSETVDHETRSLAYSDAMKALSERYPDDRDAAVLYALSLIAGGTMDDDPAFTKEKTAGMILNRVLALEPDHPGVAHYLIHGFDYPELAELAVPAARRYAAIAPDSPHAQHMPSHIFVRLGLWDDAIKSNAASAASAQSAAKALGLAGSTSGRLHAMDYLAYAYLQAGRDADADDVLKDLNAIQRADPPDGTVAYAATAIPTRLLLERRDWAGAATLELPENVRSLAPLGQFRWGEAHVLFARAIGAARSGNAPGAALEIQKLSAIEKAITVPPGSYDWRTQVSIARQVAEAWLAQAQGQSADALTMMRAAADLDDKAEKHPVTPGALLPAREQLAELLLVQGRPAQALKEFEASQSRAPGRLAGLYGAAKSARLAGDKAKAQKYYAAIVAQTAGSDGKRAEIREAREFAARLASASK